MRHDCMHCASQLSDMFVLHAVPSWQKHQHSTRLEGEPLMLCNASMFMQCMLHHAILPKHAYLDVLTQHDATYSA